MIQGISEITKTKPHNVNFKREKETKLPETPDDEFVKPEKTSEASSDGKFTKKEALKNFGKGMVSPIVALAKHPFATIGVLAGTVAACTLVPVLAPVMAVGFGALSAFQLVKGGIDAAKEYNKGNFDNSEKAFQEIGTGFVGTALSFLGLKGSAKIAAEAKVLQKSGTTTINGAQKAEIASDIAAKSKMGIFKENRSLFTTKDGMKSVLYQLKPKMIKARFNEIKGAFKKGQKAVKNRESTVAEFKKSPEGLRRAALSDEQIKAEAEILMNKAFDELGVPKELRPTLKTLKAAENECGAYMPNKHEIIFKPESYKAGLTEIDNTIMHEAVHCRENLFRLSLSPEKHSKAVKSALIDRIKNGESEKIVKKGSILGPEMMEPPKLTPKMRNSFAEFADECLYNDDKELMLNLSKYTRLKENINVSDANKAELFNFSFENTKTSLKPILDRLNKMISENPDFAAQYKNADKALDALVDYSCSHRVRYLAFKRNVPASINPKNLFKLNPEQEAATIKSVKDSISTSEGNAGISGLNGLLADSKAFNQYQFSPEEVLAQQEGNKFLIKNLTAKLAEMKKNGTLTPEKEAHINGVMTKANRVIEYKTKGLEYYKLYEKALNNPADKQLAESLKMFESELLELELLVDQKDIAQIDALLKRMIPANFALPTGIMGND